MADEKPIEDQILIDLFLYRQEHGSHRAKALDEYHEHSQAIAWLVEKRDIVDTGDGNFRITTQGQRRIAVKYPELWESSRPPYLHYAPKPHERKPNAYKRRGAWGKGKRK